MMWRDITFSFFYLNSYGFKGRIIHHTKDVTRLNITEIPCFVYTFACREDELSLCQLEMRAFFGIEAPSPNILKSSISIDPSRSPFIKERIEVIYQGDSLPEI